MENAKESKDIAELLIHLGINRTYVDIIILFMEYPVHRWILIW